MQKILSLFRSELFICGIFLLQIFLLFMGNFYKINHEVSAWLYFLCGIGIGVWVLGKFWNKEVTKKQSNTLIDHKKAKAIVVLLSIGSIGLTIGFLHNKMMRHPLDAKLSDVIPTVQELTHRFANDVYVYEPIEKFGYHLPVTYLPMQWSPFLLAEYGNFDFRWVTLGLWFIVFLLVAYHSFKKNDLVQHTIGLAALTLSYILITYYNTGVHLHAFELLIVGYYCLLMMAIQSNSALFKGLIVGICLMSRYSLLLWLPVAVVVLWKNESRRHVYTVAVTVFVFICLVYVLPYLSKDWMIFLKGYKYYDRSALGEWQHLNPSNNKPYHLFNGLGFAHLVYQNFPTWALEAKIKLLQRIHLFASLFTSTMLIYVYIKNNSKIDYKLFLLASLKIYLSVFYFFIQVPYMYLMLVDFFVGVLLYLLQAQYKVRKDKVVVHTV